MSVYLPFIEQYLPLVLSQVDRDEDSPTYGCCDRNHWHLKIRDFSSAILQQSALTLALAWSVPFKNSPYYQNPKVKEWARAALAYATQIQLKDGSFNEYYPWEHGFPPTAFCLFALCETYQILGIEDEKILRMLVKAGRWLARQNETQALNQEAAACAGLYTLSELVPDLWVKEAFNRKLTTLLSEQKADGFFSEYGGADIGYLSVTLDMLSSYYFKSGDEKMRPILDKTVHFLSYFVHPDGTAGGAYGSRNTTYFLPGGVQVMASFGNEEAAFIKKTLYQKAPKDSFLNGTDDRYWSHYLLHSFLRAFQKEQEFPDKKKPPFPFKPHRVFFEEAGLVSFQNEAYRAIIGGKKGGVLKVFKENRELFCDTGYRFKMGKKVAVTNWQDDAFIVHEKENTFEITGVFNAVRPKVATPFLHMILRGVSFFLGQRIIAFLKKQMIFSGHQTAVQFQRKVIFNPTEIEILDTIVAPFEITLKKAPVFSMRHVASGKFSTTTDLLPDDTLSLTFSGEKQIKTVWDIKKEQKDVAF